MERLALAAALSPAPGLDSATPSAVGLCSLGDLSPLAFATLHPEFSVSSMLLLSGASKENFWLRDRVEELEDNLNHTILFIEKQKQEIAHLKQQWARNIHV